MTDVEIAIARLDAAAAEMRAARDAARRLLTRSGLTDAEWRDLRAAIGRAI